MSDHAANVRRQLGELSDLGRKTVAAERRILESAERQIETIKSRILELRPMAMLDEKAGEEYQSLMENRQRLQAVVAQARSNLRSE